VDNCFTELDELRTVSSLDLGADDRMIGLMDECKTSCPPLNSVLANLE